MEIRGQKLYEIKLTMTEEDGEIFTLFSEHIEKEKEEKYFYNADEIFEWLKENTRKYVPFKIVKDNHPRFRAGYTLGNDKVIWVVVGWTLSEETIDWM